MKRILLLLTFLIPLVTFGQDQSEPKPMGLPNLCSTNQSIQANLQAGFDGPYDTDPSNWQPKIIPVVFRGINHVAGQYNDDNYDYCVEQCEKFIDHLNYAFSQGFDKTSGTIENFDETLPFSKYYFVRADKDANCNEDGSIFWQYIDGWEGEAPWPSGTGSFFINNFGYEPTKYLNVFFANISAIGFSGGIEYTNSNINSPYGVHMDYRTLFDDHTIGTSMRGPNMTPDDFTGQVLAHEVGHWVGLYHSHFDSSPNNAICEPNYDGLEPQGCYNRGSSPWNGDKCCDTPPENRGYNSNDPCTSGSQNPLVYTSSNVMSYRFADTEISNITLQQMARIDGMFQAAPTSMHASIAAHGASCYIDPNGAGCTDATACNYNPFAAVDDGSCTIPDAIGVCGGNCATNIDGDGICDDVDNCTDINACNYASFNNENCQFFDECGICGGSGPDPLCGCTEPVWPMCDCQGGIDWNQDGTCDDLSDYPAPTGVPLINPTECAIPADICLSLDISGSLDGSLGPNAFNSITTCRTITQWLYPAIIEGKVRLSIAVWASSPFGNDSYSSKVIMPLTSFQQCWNISMSFYDYLETFSNPLAALRGLGNQDLNGGTKEQAAFAASYYAQTAEEYYDATRLKNIIMISDAHLNGECNENIYSTADYIEARQISDQIKFGNHISHEKPSTIQNDPPYPILNDYVLNLQDSVPMRIIGIGLGPNLFGDQACWLATDWPAMEALCSDGSTFPAFDVSTISSIVDSLLIACDVPDPECPIQTAGYELSFDATLFQGTLVLYGNDETLAQNYNISQLLIDNTYQPVNNLSMAYQSITQGYGKHTFTWDAPDNSSISPIGIEVVYESFGNGCSEFIGVTCDSPEFQDRNLARDIWKGGFGYFDSNQNKIRMIRNPEASIFIAPINDCNVIGYNNCNNCADNCNVSTTFTPANNFDLAERIAPQFISVSQDQNHIDLGTSILKFSAGLEVIEIDISTYLTDIETQGYGIFMFPKAGLDYPDINPTTWPSQYNSEFEALFKEYAPFTGNADGNNPSDRVIFGMGWPSDDINYSRSQCMFTYLIDDCEDISNNTHVIRFESFDNNITNQTYTDALNTLGWPTNEEFFLLYEGYQRPEFAGGSSALNYTKGFFKQQVYDPFMLNYEGVTCHVNGQTFQVKRALNPLTNDGSSNSLHIRNIATDLGLTLSQTSTFEDVSDRFPSGSGQSTIIKNYVEQQISSNSNLTLPTSDFQVSMYYVDGLAAYIDANNIPLSQVEIRFPNGCSVYSQDEPEIGPCENVSSLDFNGADYNLLEIGNRCWFDRELRNIDPINQSIPQMAASTDPEAWQQANQQESPRWTYPTESEDVYWDQGWYTGGTPDNDKHLGGVLYNWWVVDQGGICPTGFHVSTNSDWNDLEKTVFGARSNKITGQSNAINFVDQQTIQSLINVGFLDNINTLYPSEPSVLPTGFGGRTPEGMISDKNISLSVSSNIVQGGLMGGVRVGVDGTFRESRTARYWWVEEEYPNKPLEFNRTDAAWSRGIKIVPDVNDPSLWDDSDDGLSRYRDLWSTSQNKGNGLFIRCVKNVE